MVLRIVVVDGRVDGGTMVVAVVAVAAVVVVSLKTPIIVHCKLNRSKE